MENKLRKASYAVLFVTLVLLILLLLLIYVQRDRVTPTNEIEYYKLYVEAFKVIAAGFGIAALGILVPAVLSEARDRFERLKQSRSAYSQAKTGDDYLPVRLCSLTLKEASALVQEVHVQKHQAELYDDELTRWLEQRFQEGDIRRNPKIWADIMYDRLFAFRELLELDADSWDTRTPRDRLQLLTQIQPTRKETAVTMTKYPEVVDVLVVLITHDTNCALDRLKARSHFRYSRRTQMRKEFLQ